MTKAAPVSEVLFGRIEGAYLTALKFQTGFQMQIIVLLQNAVVKKDTFGTVKLANRLGSTVQPFPTQTDRRTSRPVFVSAAISGRTTSVIQFRIRSTVRRFPGRLGGVVHPNVNALLAMCGKMEHVTLGSIPLLYDSALICL
jgi:hypothetical protein